MKVFYLAMLLLFGSVSHAQKIDQGIEAAEKYWHSGDKTKAVSIYQELAKKGGYLAQFKLGVCYSKGDGILIDKYKAAEWFMKSAKQGYSPAQFFYGYCCNTGEGIKINQKKAAKWYLKAAQRGYALAQHNLGVCYSRGEGVKMDKYKAAWWYGQAANQKLAIAQYSLSRCYFTGEGILKSRKEAMKWLQKAANQGHNPALRSLEKLKETFVEETDSTLIKVEIYKTKITESYNKGQYNKAISYEEKILTIVGKSYGKKHINYASCLNNLALLYKKVERDEEAISTYLEAIEIIKKTLGIGNLKYIRTINNIAALYQHIGNFEKSENLCLEAIKIQERILNIKSIDYANSLNILAGVYKHTGRYEEAELLYHEAIDISKKEKEKENEPAYVAYVINLADLYELQKRYTEAEALYLEAIILNKKIYGINHPDYLINLDALIFLYDYTGQLKKAKIYYLERIDIIKNTLSEEDLEYTISLNNLALICKELGEFEKAEYYYTEVLKIKTRAHNTDTLGYAQVIHNLASLYEVVENYPKADSLYSIALEIREKILGKNHLLYAQTLGNQASLMHKKGHYEESKKLHLKTIEIRKSAFEEDPISYTVSLSNFALLCKDMGEYLDAEKYLVEAKGIWEKDLNFEHPSYSSCLNNLGILYLSMARYKEAEVLFLNVQKTLKTTTGENHYYVQLLGNMSNMYVSMGQYKKADSLYAKVVQLNKKQFGEQHSSYGLELSNWGKTCHSASNYTKSEKLLLQAKDVLKKSVGETHHFYLSNMNSLGVLYMDMGLYDKAQQILIKTKETTATVFGKKHLNYATTLINLSSFYQEFDQYDNAESLLLEAKKILKEKLGVEHLNYLTCLNNLASLYMNMERIIKGGALFIKIEEVKKKILGDEHPEYADALVNLVRFEGLFFVEKSEKALLKALEINKNTRGIHHPSYATCLASLALLYTDMKRYEEAEKYYLQVIEKEVSMEDQLSYATSLNNLAMLYFKLKRYKEAESFFIKATKIRKQYLGADNPIYAKTLDNLARTYIEMGVIHKALPLKTAALKGLGNYIRAMYNSLGEWQQQKLLDQNYFYFESFYSFSFTSSFHDSLLIHAQNSMLSIKGLSAENTQMIQQIIRQSKDESLKKLYKDLLKAKRELAAVYSLSLLKQKEKNINIQTWKRKVSDLELQLAIQSKPLGYKHQIQNTKVTFNDLKHHLNQGGAVIDFVHFRHKNTDSTYNRLYYAMITRHDSQYPVCVRLGTEKELKLFFSKEIKLKGDNYIHDDRVNYDLYQLIWKPLMPHLVGVKEIHLSPDGLLNQLSFEALLSSAESEERLISKYKLHYYSTLKHFVLPALASDRQKNTQVMLLGGANYGTEVGSNHEKSFKYLKGAKEEVSALAAAFTDAKWQVQLLTGDNALEQKVKEVEGLSSPRVIHLATHGYFYPPPKDYKKQVDVWINDENAYQHRIQQHEHPLYRSGLALAGANLTWTGRPKGTLDFNDGILTAYEVAMLDLYGTELVVLSACKTGRGESSDTEGVYGLQRAFKQAGVSKLIVSLWKVDDDATKKFMSCFYKNYLSGLPASEALESTKITMQKIYPNPYYWAAFILIE